jgi:prolipoprotein diacylglyceryl transferase
VYLAYLPSPSQGVWHLGPLPIRAYALCIIVGIVVAVWVGERRYVARGGRPGTVMDVAVWAVIFGLVGGRLYHVLSDPELYFGAGRHPVDAFKVWNGGLGIWGAISLGGIGAWIGCRRAGIRLPPYADAVAPGIVLAQAIGRWGNYFNQELFGKPTTLPWGIRIDAGREGTVPGAQAYHPTFLYESLWDVGVAGLVVWADRRFTLGRGRAFALYVMAYTAGRLWIEALRVDHANTVLGLRLNIWTSILVFAGALAYFLLRRGPRETNLLLAAPGTGPDAPLADAPLADAPLADAPLADVPLVDGPVADAPVADGPVADDPVADGPRVDGPAGGGPRVDGPAGGGPRVDGPVADAPVADRPVGDVPRVDGPVADDPVADRPVGDVPLVDASGVDEPAGAARPDRRLSDVPSDRDG